MKTTKPTFIHIGGPKTGTSTLQQDVFPFHSEIDYRDWDIAHSNCFSKAFYSDSMYSNDTEIELAKQEINSLNERTNNKEKKICLHSREHLMHHVLDTLTTAKRICDLFDRPKIIITIRNQYSAMTSRFQWSLMGFRRQYLSPLPGVDINNYVKNAISNVSLRGTYMNLCTSFDYGHVASCYAELIGWENVGVFMLEEMAYDIDAYSHKMASFLGVDEQEFLNLLSGKKRNQAFTRRQYNYYKFKAVTVPLAVHYLSRNIQTPKLLNKFLLGGPKLESKLDFESKSLIKKRYQDGNDILDNRYNLPLKRYGYPLSK